MVEALLRKYPKSQLVKALKAFCAAHLNKRDTAEKILEDIVREGPQDDRVLHTMSFVYKALGSHDGILEAYKAAVEKKPLDPDVRIGLCGHYVRRLEYIQQQQESFKLAKVDPGNADMYVWWSICSLVMQSCTAAVEAQSFEDTMVARLLNLACTMAEQRRQKTGKISFEKFYVLCEILCGLGKHSDALDLAMHFDSVCEDKVPESDIRMIVGTLQIRAGNFNEASSTFLSVALHNPQHWVAWHAYIATKLPELADCNTLPLERIDGGIAEIWDGLYLNTTWQRAIAMQEITTVEERLVEVQTSLDGMMEKHKGQPEMKRALALAQLETAKYSSLQKKDMGYLTDIIIEVIPTLTRYSSFGADLRGYICFLDDDNKKRVLAKGSHACSQVAQELLKNDSSIQGERKAFICQINGYLLQSETIGVGFSDAMDMIRMYYQNTHLVKEFDPKDRGLGEELLVTAVVPLLQSANSNNEEVENLLVLALLFIERAQVERTVSAPLRLAASAIYGLLGAQSLAIAQFARLDIKGVLHDSLTGHWLVPILSALCPTQDVYQKWFDGIVNLHTVQEMEARDALFTAYEQQTYSKVPEFVDFIKCLNQSSTFYLYKSEKGMLDLRNLCILGKKLGEDYTIPHVDDIIHNDDLTVRPFWYPPSDKGPLSELLAWWELDVGNCSHWWMHQGNQDSRERKAWEASTNRQIMSRLQFPVVMKLVCSPCPLEEQHVIEQWLRMEVEQFGITFDGADPSNICNMANKITTMMESSKSFSSLPECLTTVTVLFGYHTQLVACGKCCDEGSMLSLLEKSIRVVMNKCDDLLKHTRQAGIILLCRLCQESLVWVAQVVKSFILFCKENGSWRHMSGMAKELKTFSGNFLSIISSTEMCQFETRLDCATLQKNRVYIQGVDYLEGFDVQEWLSKLNQSQTLVRNRIEESLQQIKNMLEMFVMLS